MLEAPCIPCSNGRCLLCLKIILLSTLTWDSVVNFCYFAINCLWLTSTRDFALTFFLLHRHLTSFIYHFYMYESPQSNLPHHSSNTLSTASLRFMLAHHGQGTLMLLILTTLKVKAWGFIMLQGLTLLCLVYLQSHHIQVEIIHQEQHLRFHSAGLSSGQELWRMIPVCG